MDVDEARCDGEPARVDLDRAPLRGFRHDAHDSTVHHDDVGFLASSTKSVEDGAASNDDVGIGTRAKQKTGSTGEKRGGAGGSEKVATCLHGDGKRCRR